MLVTLAGVIHIVVYVKASGTTPSNQKSISKHDHLSKIIRPKPFSSKLGTNPCGTRAECEFQSQSYPLSINTRHPPQNQHRKRVIFRRTNQVNQPQPEGSEEWSLVLSKISYSLLFDDKILSSRPYLAGKFDGVFVGFVIGARYQVETNVQYYIHCTRLLPLQIATRVNYWTAYASSQSCGGNPRSSPWQHDIIPHTPDGRFKRIRHTEKNENTPTASPVGQGLRTYPTGNAWRG